jgi:protoporphyrinogen oxidase
MNVAIIGGGLTGLSAAYTLTKSGHTVTVFEKAPFLGGLAHGFKAKNWDWTLESAYHHFFTNDETLITLAKEIGLTDDIIISRPITSTLIPFVYRNATRAVSLKNFSGFTSERSNTSDDKPTHFAKELKPGENFSNDLSASTKTNEDGSKFSFTTLAFQIFQLDSPISLLKFNQLPFVDRIRTGMLLAYCKITPFWQPLEKVTTEVWLKKWGGTPAWKIIWEPLLYGKFGTYADKVAASWFWARIKKRTTNLGYFRGGFQIFTDQLSAKITKSGGLIYTDFPIESIVKSAKTGKFQIKPTVNQPKYESLVNEQFDQVLLTTPTPIAAKLINIPKSYFTASLAIPHLWAQTLILETDEPILDKIYWLNINDRSFPFLACVAHTNFMDKKHYGGHHLTYFGNYLPDNHPFLKMNKEKLYKEFEPYIKRLSANNHLPFTVYQSYVYTVPFAQPVHELHYSKRAPKMETPIPGLYLANMDSIYPWDRGTNYAVELGLKAAEKILGK